MQKPLTMPMLPMRDMVVFPRMVAPFFVGRKPSMEALENALEQDRRIFVVSQRDPSIENPSQDDMYSIGVVGTILQIMKLPNGTIKALFEAGERAKLVNFTVGDSGYVSTIQPMEASVETSTEMMALAKTVKNELENYSREVKRKSESIDQLSINLDQPEHIADLIAPLLSWDLPEKQALLEVADPKERLQRVFERMLEEMEIRKLEKKLKERVQGQIGRTQKEYYLNEQIKAIQKEMGNGEDGKAEIDDYKARIEKTALSKEANEVALKELKKLRLMSSMSAESNVVRNYIDTLLSMPWGEKTKDAFNLSKAENILNRDHYGLEKVKERIIEYLAVSKHVGKLRGPILCLVGPPGVGKTSLAYSIARTLGRKFARISLGGIRDEAEIYGHRRTYIGALPGKIVQSLQKAKSSNPLLLLDEVDKMSHGMLGDPAAALLEVLDKEQNATFMDHYLEVEYDLSDVLFICTANTLDGIPAPLLDRMEVISLPGYTELEKTQIAKRYLVEKQSKENGLNTTQVRVRKEALQKVITDYTREAGVRSLERNIGTLMRKTATEIIKQKNKGKEVKSPRIITAASLLKMLGVPKYKHQILSDENEVGTATGMAWTQVGGELLQTEVRLMPGDGRLSITGRLGDVMKESVSAAMSYVRSHANRLGIYTDALSKYDIHIHFPEGAVPKDGPSAGVTLITAIVSAYTGIPVRQRVSMTGEITLRGKVLAIGGLKEKLLAAKRDGVVHALIPWENQKDLVDVPEEIKNELKISPLKHVDRYLEIALEHPPEAVTDPSTPEATGLKEDEMLPPSALGKNPLPPAYT